MHGTSNKASMNGENESGASAAKTMGAWSKRMGKRIKVDTSLYACTIYDSTLDKGSPMLAAWLMCTCK
jgi:hypothetical protein